MQDVADLAGVSQTTVSFVLNKVSTVSIPDETRERVWAAMREVGYRPNAAAKFLRTSRSHSFGFVTDEVASTPFAGDIIRGAQDAAWSNEKLLLIINTGGNAAIEESAVNIMLERRVEAIIYAHMRHELVDPPAAIREVPTVLLNCFCADRSFPSVVPDEIGGGRGATNELLRQGHRRVGFINLPAHIPPAIGRLLGYQQALESNHLPFDPDLVRYGNGNADTGYEYTVDLMRLADPPTAIFCCNDRTAMGAYDALKELALSIPDDVAVIGFDNQELIAAYLRPPLTTMALPFNDMGIWAVNYLIEHTSYVEDGDPIQHTIATRLVERKSI